MGMHQCGEIDESNIVSCIRGGDDDSLSSGLTHDDESHNLLDLDVCDTMWQIMIQLKLHQIW